ncbi:DNA polymerase III subunit beta [Calothrix rhizosoleniae]|uniref:DNA polymerase III subunit beta n=1 Tax=Calothrix rhizosoleniae TaxID=888997 RepID=UPI000B4A1139|nr:DNA polymerase III subunit beta [Calothrix rhizosoleniae]
MKLVCTQSDLSTHLSLVSRAVPSRPTHPVLANVLLQADADNNQVSLTAFDLSLGIRTSFSAEVFQGGVLALPAKLLNDITSRLPEGDITLDDESNTVESESSEGLTLTLTPQTGRYQVRAMAGEEFPELPLLEEAQTMELSADALIAGLRGSLFATSADETKQVLTGVHLKVQPDTLEFAATDGHRLALVETANENPDGNGENQLEVTVPSKALRELEKMLVHNKSENELVTLNFDAGQVVFQWQNQRLTSRTLEGQYPAYGQLIPSQFEREINLDRRQFVTALERIAVFADQKNNIVKINIDSIEQEITLSVEAQELGSGRDSIPAEISGDDIVIAFNVKYLMEGLKALPSTEILMQVNQPLTPVIFKPLGGINMTYLAMPVQLRN